MKRHIIPTIIFILAAFILYNLEEFSSRNIVYSRNAEYTIIKKVTKLPQTTYTIYTQQIIDGPSLKAAVEKANESGWSMYRHGPKGKYTLILGPADYEKVLVEMQATDPHNIKIRYI